MLSPVFSIHNVIIDYQVSYQLNQNLKALVKAISLACEEGKM